MASSTINLPSISSRGDEGIDNGNDVTIELATQVPLPASSSSLGHTNSHSSFAPRVVSVLGLENRDVVSGTSLAPVDEGFGAWSFLAGAFVVEAIIWGFPYSFGSFLSAYLSDPFWSTQKDASSLLSLVGTLSSGIIYCSGAFLNPFLSRFPRYRRPLMWTGAALCGFSLLGASYTTKVSHLVIIQGCLYGIGGSFAYFPTVSLVQEWFVRRRGLASGMVFAGTAAGGLILPLVLPRSIQAHGIPATLRYLSAVVLISLAISLPFVRPRLPETRVHGPGRRSNGDRMWLKDWRWWFILSVNTMQGCAYFIPIVWLPTYASSLNVSASTSSLSTALLNGAGVFGRVTTGFLSDRLSPWLLAFITLLSTSAATFLLWGVAGHAVAGLLLFGTIYGLLAAGFTSMYTAFLKPIAKDDLTLSVDLFALLLLTRGIGNVLSSPISSALSSSAHAISREKTGFDVDSGRYEKLIIYVGTCFGGAAIVTLVGWLKERTAMGGRNTHSTSI